MFSHHPRLCHYLMLCDFHAIDCRDLNYVKLLFPISAFILKSTAVFGKVESLI